MSNFDQSNKVELESRGQKQLPKFISSTNSEGPPQNASR